MDFDEILDEYEALWRAAAMDDRAQAHGPGRNGEAVCAVLVAPLALKLAADKARIDGWLCSVCGRLSMYSDTIGGIARHMNDNHLWTWLDFANKFRDALAEGERLASASTATR